MALEDYLQGIKLEVSDLQESDLPSLEILLRYWMRDGEIVDEEEVARALQRLQSALDSEKDYHYMVDRVDGVPVAMVGLVPPADNMKGLTSSPNPIELVNFYTQNELRGKGIGSRLLEQVINYAKGREYSEIVLNSGSRYEQTWPFYNRRFGEGQLLKNYYGQHDAMFWSLAL